eukprot:15460640-Alexandrium_andersonii.AAC.1
MLASEALAHALPELSGRALLCHCSATAACHGDVIINEFKRRFGFGLLPLSARVALPWSPEQFVEQARAAGHPFDRVEGLPPASADAVRACLELGPVAVKQR